MKFVVLFALIFVCHFSWADAPSCHLLENSQGALQDVAKATCAEMKESKQCQDLYKSLSAEDVKEKALTCSDDHSSFAKIKAGAEFYAGCYVGGWAMVVDPIRDSVTGLQNKIKNFSLSKSEEKNLDRETAKAERELCDNDPNAKLNLIKAYNDSAPELLKIKEPSQHTLNGKTCASVLATLKGFREQKLDELGNSLMRKEVIGEALTDDEKKFVEFRNSNLNIQGIDVVELAKTQIKEMGIEIDCYNNYYAARITCEAASTVATLAAGPAGLALKAAKLAKIAKLAGVINKSEKTLVAERAAASGNAAKSASAIPKLKDLSEADRAKELARRASLTKEQRIAEVESRWGRKLSSAEGDALENAHNIGVGTGRGNNGTLATTDHIKKMNTLKRGDESLSKSAKLSAAEKPTYTAAERKFLMDEGYAGHSADILEARAYADRTRLGAEKLRASGKIEESRKAYDEAAKSYDVILKDKLYPLSERDYAVGATINAHAGTPERLKSAGELYIKSKSEFKYVEGGVSKKLSKEQVIFEDLQRERNELRSLAAKYRGTAAGPSAQENYEIHKKLIESVVNQIPKMPDSYKYELLKP